MDSSEKKRLSPVTPIHRIGERAARPKSIFFSYGHDDNAELVRRIKGDLEKRGHTIWFDEKDIGTWDDWRGKITRGIDQSQMAIAFLSKHAIRDPGVCRNEIAIALNRFGTIHPILLESSIEKDIPVGIDRLNWTDLSQWRDIRDGRLPGICWAGWYETKLHNLIEKLECECTSFAEETRVLRLALQPQSFQSQIAQHVPGFIGREWLFDAYHHWLDNQRESRLFWIKGGPGVGKSAIAANLAHRERGTVIASWFCNSHNSELRNPDAFLKSLAFQLALSWEDYRVHLLRRLELSVGMPDDICEEVRKTLSRKSTEGLFNDLLAEPMVNLIWRNRKLVVIIDALDEATDAQGNNKIADLIGQQSGRLPDWFGFVATSRPEADIVNRLAGYNPFELDAQDTRNLADLRFWINEQLFARKEFAEYTDAETLQIEDLLVDRSSGMILYLKLVEEGLKERSLDVEQIKTLVTGLPGLYRRFYDSFQWRFGKDYDIGIKPLLRLLLAADSTLPEDLSCTVLRWNSEQFLACRNRLGSYMVDTPSGYKLFHRSLAEWLSAKDSGPFFLDRTLGQQPLADALFAEIETDEKHEVRWHGAIVEWLPEWLPLLAQYNNADSCNTLGVFLSRSGPLVNALRPLERALSLRKGEASSSSVSLAAQLFKITGSTNEQLDIEQSLNNLAHLLIDLGRMEEAELYLRDAHSILNGAFLPFEEFCYRIAVSASTRASLLKEMGRFDEAEPLYREALQNRMASLPEGHPGIAPYANNLGILLMTTGRYAEAEPLLKLALAMRRFALPEGDPEIAQSLNNMAVLLGQTDRLVEAESLIREALAISRDFPHAGPLAIAHSVQSLAAVLYTTRRYDEAEPLYREALAIRKKALPEGHPVIGMSLNDLANVFAATKRMGKAEFFYREARSILKVGLPAGHPNSVQNMYDLANLLFTKGCGDEAEELYREAASIWKAALPGGHPKIPHIFDRLAELCYANRRDDEAETYLREALATYRVSLAADHPQVARSFDNLARLLVLREKKDEAELLFRDALALRQAYLPTGHRDIAESISNLAGVLYDTNRYDEAEPLLRQALAIFRAVQPAEHPEIAIGCNNLAQLLRNTCRYDEAESLYGEALNILKSALPKGHPLTVQCLISLAKLFDATDRDEAAEALRLEAADV